MAVNHNLDLSFIHIDQLPEVMLLPSVYIILSQFNVMEGIDFVYGDFFLELERFVASLSIHGSHIPRLSLLYIYF
jgi:hypothetical protein